MRNLITPQEVIDLAFAENSNMMAESISDTAIRIAEIKYIRPAFGVMYPLLADKYADYTNDYVKPALAYFVKCEIVSSIAIDMSNSGVAVANPQYQSAATDKQRQRLYDSEMSKAKTLLDFALEYIATHSEEFPDFSGEAPKKHHRVGGILLGGGTSRSQSASIAGEAFKAEFDGYLREMNEISEEVSELKENAEKATENAEAATAKTNEAIARAEQATKDATEAATKATTATENADVATEQAKTATANANDAAQRANEEVQKIKEKADTDKYYPLMSVGMADNLVGRGDVQDAQINFRPSGGVLGVSNGMNITDGAARIERIKGNSVVYNQLLLNADFRDGTKSWGGGAATIEKEDDYILWSAVASSALLYQEVEWEVNHKLLILVDFQRLSDANVRFAVYLKHKNAEIYDKLQITAYSSLERETMIVTLTSTNEIETLYIYPYLGSIEIGAQAKFYSVRAIDLTKEFGAGNEPTTYEEYLQRKPMNIEDEFAYNEGELIDMNVNSLISTSDNAYDYTRGYARVMGGVPYTFTVDNLNDRTEEVYFSETLPVTTSEENIIYPNADGTYTFPSNGYAKGSFQGYEVGREDSICICLKHSYDKPHPPYQQEVKDLSFIREAFQEGMRRTPLAVNDSGVAIPNTDVFDEISFNPTKGVWEKITRIGVAVVGQTLNFLKGTVFYAVIPDMKNATSGVYYERRSGFFTSKYSVPRGVAVNTMGNKTILRWIRDNTIYINDSAYTTAREFNEANKDLVIYYELAEPIVEEIEGSENWNLDYRAWDFGTEEAIVPNNVPSAPFRADINYEPNAVDDLRWAISEIRSLRAELAQLQSAQTSETNLTE